MESKLTPRRLEVAQLLADGYNMKEVADRMGIRYQTAKNHICTLNRDLNCSGQSHVVACLLRQGVIK